MKTLKSGIINLFLVLFICSSTLGCDHGGFIIGEIKGTIDVPGQRAIVVLLVFILLALAAIAWFGYEKVFEPLAKILEIEPSISSAAEKIRNDIDLSSEIHKLEKSILAKECEIARCETEISLIKARAKEAERDFERQLGKYKEDYTWELKISEKKMKAKEVVLNQKIARLEAYVDLCAHYLAKYKINIYSPRSYEIDVQKRVWQDQLLLGHLDMVINNICEYCHETRAEQDKISEITQQQSRLKFLEKEFSQGTKTSGEYSAEINKILMSTKKFIEENFLESKEKM